MEKSRRERLLSFVNDILSHPAFNKTFKRYIETSGDVKKSEIVQIMKKCNLKDIDSDATYDRRASTIR
jgi:hypothetical protein